MQIRNFSNKNDYSIRNNGAIPFQARIDTKNLKSILNSIKAYSKGDQASRKALLDIFYSNIDRISKLENNNILIKFDDARDCFGSYSEKVCNFTMRDISDPIKKYKSAFLLKGAAMDKGMAFLRALGKIDETLIELFKKNNDLY